MILVFGKNGQVGTELNSYKDVHALGRECADLSNPQSCEDAIINYQPKAVINAAAYTAVDNAESDIYLASLINGEAPGAMANACAKLGIPLVHISTDYVFDGSGTTSRCTSDLPNPLNVYGKSKLKGELAIKASGCVFAILRTSWVVSAHGNNFLITMRRLSQTRDQITVVDDQLGGPTCASDIAQTCMSIAKQLILAPGKTGVYHYTGQPNVSWCQFANAIFEETGSLTVATPILTSRYPTAALRPLNSRLDCSETEEVFGISRPFWRNSIKTILKELDQTYDKP